jgi:hypothetical protein
MRDFAGYHWKWRNRGFGGPLEVWIYGSGFLPSVFSHFVSIDGLYWGKNLFLGGGGGDQGRVPVHESGGRVIDRVLAGERCA